MRESFTSTLASYSSSYFYLLMWKSKKVRKLKCGTLMFREMLNFRVLLKTRNNVDGKLDFRRCCEKICVREILFYL